MCEYDEYAASSVDGYNRLDPEQERDEMIMQDLYMDYLCEQDMKNHSY